MIGTHTDFHFSFPMPLFSFIALLFLTLLGCGGSNSFGKETYAFDRITVSHEPDRVPPAIPRSFLPAQASFIDSSELRSGFSNSREAYLKLESDLSKEEIKKTLETRSSLGDWKLLQKDEEDKRTTYLFEGFIKKSLSVLVYDLGDKRLVKYFFKKQSAY